jgi:hypothetical protein
MKSPAEMLHLSCAKKNGTQTFFESAGTNFSDAVFLCSTVYIIISLCSFNPEAAGGIIRRVRKNVLQLPIDFESLISIY